MNPKPLTKTRSCTRCYNHSQSHGLSKCSRSLYFRRLGTRNRHHIIEQKCVCQGRRSSAVFQKRATAATERATLSATLKNVDNFDLELSGRQLKIQLSSSVSEDVITQFVKAMKAQFLVYSGKGLLSVSLQSNGSVVTVSLANATKPDLKKVEEILLQLI